MWAAAQGRHRAEGWSEGLFIHTHVDVLCTAVLLLCLRAVQHPATVPLPADQLRGVPLAQVPDRLLCQAGHTRWRPWQSGKLWSGQQQAGPCTAASQELSDHADRGPTSLLTGRCILNLPWQVGIEHIPELTAKARRNLARDPALAQLVADGVLLLLLPPPPPVAAAACLPRVMRGCATCLWCAGQPR